jgi:preprotein translocase subunit SecA
LERLAEQYAALRVQVRAGASWNEARIVIPAFSITAAAVRQVLGVDPYEVQVMSGLALARGNIAEMQTGEGKTLATAFPALLFALADRGVHVMTVNAYLAARDFETLSPVFSALGAQAGLLRAGEELEPRSAAYRCPITYGPGYEFGFDYLRDQLSRLQEADADDDRGWGHRTESSTPARQRRHEFAIVDEADSVLIDEAGTPLVISRQPAAPHPHPEPFRLARDVALSLRPGEDFEIDAQQGLQLSPAARRRLRIPPSHPRSLTLQRPWMQYVEQAAFAQFALRRDVDYVVSDGHVRIVDLDTGRILADRSWQGGLHQSVEAKERLEITTESLSAARISRQRYFRLYKLLSGLTGTAATAAVEFADVYGVAVAAIPLRTRSRRVTIPTRYFADEPSKWDALVEDVAARNQRGQPVLIGTGTISQSDELARRFARLGLSCHLLNGRQTADEAAVVAAAGQRGAVTIATNMAGRGTDIRLGQDVTELGGLHVIATQHHESERVDRQLIGRCARQGDPGSCQFFVSAQDRLIAVHSPVLARQMRRLAGQGGEVRVDLSAQIRVVQTQAEHAARLRRQDVAQYDEWLTDLVTRLS